MEISVEGWVLGVLVVLPGFVAAAVRAAIVPEETAPYGEWIAGSIVSSLVLNAVAFLVALLATQIWWGFMPDLARIELAKPVGEIAGLLQSVSGNSTVCYVIILYGLAVLWGVASGVLSLSVSLRWFAFHLRLTPVSPAPNVLPDVLEHLAAMEKGARKESRKKAGERSKSEPLVHWLRIKRDNLVILGQLKTSNVKFSLEQPVELFLSPAHLYENGAAVERPEAVDYDGHLRGLYVRLLPLDLVEILITGPDWVPAKSLTASDQ